MQGGRDWSRAVTGREGDGGRERLGLEGEAAIRSREVDSTELSPTSPTEKRMREGIEHGSGVDGRTEERKERRRQSRAHPRPIINRPRYDNVIL